MPVAVQNRLQWQSSQFRRRKPNGIRTRIVTGKLVDLKNFKPDDEFLETFKPQYDSVFSYVNRVIGESKGTISSRDSYFGTSAFIYYD